MHDDAGERVGGRITAGETGRRAPAVQPLGYDKFDESMINRSGMNRGISALPRVQTERTLFSPRT